LIGYSHGFAEEGTWNISGGVA